MKQKSLLRKSYSVFKKWNRKGYSVFSSLRHVVAIGCLAVSYLLFANSNVANAQDENEAVTKNYNLESIDVTSDELPEAYSDISRVVVTVTKSEIERAGFSSFNELLEYATNIDIRQRGTGNVQADISVRGGTFDQVLILLNGVNITDPQTGHHNLNLPFDLSIIQRIEVLKGPGAWKFGPGAFSGAINIVTGTDEDAYVKTSVNTGQFGFHSEVINGGFSTQNTSHTVSLNHSSSKGYTDNTDYEIKNIYYHGNLSVKNTDLSMQIGATDKGFGANSFYTAMYPDQYEEVQTYFASVGAKTKIKAFQINPRFYYRRNNDRFVLFRENPASWYTTDNFHTSDVLGANILGNYIHGTSATTTIGFDARNETIRSNKLGELTDDVVFSPVNDTIELNRYHSRTNFSAFAGHKRYFNNIAVNVGVNFTYNTDIESRWFVYPGIDFSYDINKNSSVFVSANKTMRMPTYTDLYYEGPSNEGNPNLSPEEALGIDFGYKYNNKIFSGEATLFYMKGDNMIDWVRETVNDKWRTINYTELNTYGAEVSIKADLEKAFKEQEILKSLKLNYTNVNQTKVESDYISNYSLNYLKHRVDVSLNHKIWKNLHTTWHWAYQDRNGQYEKIVDKVSEGMVDYDPFFTTDLKIYWIKQGWNVFVSVNNIFDIEYYDIGNVPQPGRWVKVGISKRIDF